MQGRQVNSLTATAPMNIIWAFGILVQHPCPYGRTGSRWESDPGRSPNKSQVPAYSWGVWSTANTPSLV